MKGIAGLLREMWHTFLLHGVVAHVNNGLVPVMAFLLLLTIVTRNVHLDHTVMHLLVITVCMVPVSFFSGVRDWRKKFHGSRAPIFYRKIRLTGLLFLLGGSALAIRLTQAELFARGGVLAWIYAGCIFGSVPVVVVLGHYGVKLASVRK